MDRHRYGYQIPLIGQRPEQSGHRYSTQNSFRVSDYLAAGAASKALNSAASTWPSALTSTFAQSL